MVGRLEAREVAVAYPGGAVALDGLTASFGPAELCAVIGPNGAGKSSLLRALAGLLRPTAGEILLDGEAVGRLTPRVRARSIAYLQQSLVVPPAMTVRSIVMMARYAYLTPFASPRPQDDEVVDRCLSEVDASHLARRRAGQLSGGERQRVLLARALAQETSFVLLDEPTAGLDPAHQLAFLERVRQLVDGTRRSVVVVSHDLNAASQFATHLLLLHEGRVAAQGSAATVLRPEVLGPVYGGRLVFGGLPARAAGGALRPWVLPWAIPEDVGGFLDADRYPGPE